MSIIFTRPYIKLIAEGKVFLTASQVRRLARKYMNDVARLEGHKSGCACVTCEFKETFSESDPLQK